MNKKFVEMAPHQLLVNRSFMILRTNASCAENWSFYLMNPEFADEPELRDRLGTIWICALLDTMERHQGLLPQLAREAEENHWEHVSDFLLQVETFCDYVAEVLMLLTREEQIFVLRFRNQLVHGYLDGELRESVPVKFFVNGVFKKEVLPWQEHTAIQMRMHEKPWPDQVIRPIITRVIDERLPYWQAIAKLMRVGSHPYNELLQQRFVNLFPRR